MSFQSRLKERREELNISRSDMAKALSVTVGAISNYENGVSSPRVELLFKMFNILQCDANYLYQDDMYINDEYEFKTSISEQNHIRKYRALDQYGKELINVVMDKHLEQLTKHKKEFIQLEPFPVKPRFLTGLSAGSGLYIFDDIPCDMVEVPFEYESIDFVIGVTGNSMEPTYLNGDEVMVIKKKSIEIGEIGAFMIDGEAYIKEFRGDHLKSHNEKYEDIYFNDDMEISCIGKVEGKLKWHAK